MCVSVCVCVCVCAAAKLQRNGGAARKPLMSKRQRISQTVPEEEGGAKGEGGGREGEGREAEAEAAWGEEGIFRAGTTPF